MKVRAASYNFILAYRDIRDNLLLEYSEIMEVIEGLDIVMSGFRELKLEPRMLDACFGGYSFIVFESQHFVD